LKRMETKILKVSPRYPEVDKLKIAAQIIKRGGTAAFPTETVYGLGANGLNPAAIKKIFWAKGRPLDNPLILHIAEINELGALVKEVSFQAEKLISKFWPGPITLVFKKSFIVPDEATAGLDTVAIRMPANSIARMLIRLSECPIAAPSANLSGKPSPTKVEHVIADLLGKVDLIIDGGDTPVGVESTVIDVTRTPPMILRPGGITREQLEEVLGEIRVDQMLDLKNGKPRSPGLKYRHYSPDAQVIVIEGAPKNRVKKIKTLLREKRNQGLKVGVMCVDETLKMYENIPNVLSMGKEKRPETIAPNMYNCLRGFDLKGVDVILVEGISERGMGLAIMNRLRKAAGFNVIKV